MNDEFKLPQDWMPEAIEKYLTECVDDKTLPTVEGFCLKNSISPDMVEDAAEANAIVSGSYTKLLIAQKNKLIQKGLNETWNAGFAKFLLSANHGMMEAEKRILTGEQDNPIKIDIGTMLDKAYGDKTTSTG